MSVVAIIVTLVNLVGVISWFAGGLRGLGGEAASSLLEALPSVLAAVLAALLASQITLRAFELPARDFWHRYGIMLASVCIGGSIEGGLLGWVFSLDGTLFPEPPPGVYAGDPLRLLGDFVLALLGGGLVGAVIGLAVGLAEGLVLGLPLAKLLGVLSDEG